jgi:hypothetical protein
MKERRSRGEVRKGNQREVTSDKTTKGRTGARTEVGTGAIQGKDGEVEQMLQ